MNVRLNGITFVELPYITKGEEVTVERETGEAWDSEARPAYSVKLEGCHIGYIPLIETVKEEAKRAEEGYKKVYKSEYDSMSKEEIRKLANELNESGKMIQLRDWRFIGYHSARNIARAKMQECETLEIVRNWLYTEIMQNHTTPRATVLPMYYDEKEGRNFNEIGDICSISVTFNTECGEGNPLGTQTSASLLAKERALRDYM